MLWVQVASINVFICDNWKELFSIKVYRKRVVLLNHHVVSIFNNYSGGSPCFTPSPQHQHNAKARFLKVGCCYILPLLHFLN